MDKPTISYEDFEKLDLRVAKITNVSEIEGADKLYKIDLDVAGESRTICAGIKEHYSPEELEGKKIIIIANLEPRKLRGIESQGMLLAASTPDHEDVILLTTDKDIESGSSIS